MHKEELIEEIKNLISTDKSEVVEINPNYLQYFELDELEQIKDKLLDKKKKIIENNSSFLDEIYEKTKKDGL